MILRKTLLAFAAGSVFAVPVFNACADDGVFPPSADDHELPPAEHQYFDTHPPVHQSNAMDGVFPPSADDHELLPAEAQYLEQKAERIGAEERDHWNPG